MTQAKRARPIDRGEMLDTVMLEIHKNYREASLSNIAREYGVSLAYVSECVKAETGKTYKELLHKCRIEQAARLLRGSSLSIKQVMSAVGYENSSYFYSLFYDRFGQTPLEYRRYAAARRYA